MRAINGLLQTAATKQPISAYANMSCPAKRLCVTAGQQPYMDLQMAFKDEACDGLDPQFLDAPCFTGSGGSFAYEDPDGKWIALDGMIVLTERLA